LIQICQAELSAKEQRGSSEIDSLLSTSLSLWRPKTKAATWTLQAWDFVAALGTKVSAEKLLSIHRDWLEMKMETKLEAQMETQ